MAGIRVYNKSIFNSMCLFLCLIFVMGTSCDTVHFTNSQSHVERSYESSLEDGLKTYQLEVPGSSPITIIEAEPVKKEDRSHRTAKSFSRDPLIEYSDRKTKDYIVPGSSHENEYKTSSKDKESGRCFGSSCQDDQIDNKRKTVYSPDLLTKFLKEYADKIRNADRKTKEKLQQMEITTSSDDMIITDENKKYDKNFFSEKLDTQDHSDGNRRYSNWDEVDSKRHKHPYDDPEGWVALEAVPWTRSKISKWQANTQKVNKPNNNFNSYEYEKDPSVFDDRFSSPGYGSSDSDSDFVNKPFNSFSHHSKPNNYNYRPNYENPNQESSWPPEMPSRPSWQKPSYNNRPSQHSSNDKRPHRPDCDHNDEHSDSTNRRVANNFYDRDGIITDGGSSDFPASGLGYKSKYNYRKPSQVVYDDYNYQSSDHPSTYPNNGDGQWVLLSTAKGYKFPKNRQRSLSLSPSALISHRSVRLTVLPAVNGSTENMTLSHGGLLEVEPSFHTVDESKLIYDRSRRANSSNSSKPNKKKKIITTDPTPDGSAVMAAVGAGMVPATMAMIMPMVLGRKKRNAVNPFLQQSQIFQNVTQHPHLDFESTLQRTF